MRKILHNAVCMGSSMQRKTFLYLIQGLFKHTDWGGHVPPALLLVPPVGNFAPPPQ